MEDRYFFDKRVMKKVLLKYGSIFICLLPVLIVVNYFLNQVLHFWLTVVVDCVIILFILFIVELIIGRIKQKKEERENDFVVIKAKEIKEKRKNANNSNNSDATEVVVKDNTNKKDEN